jgi:hypothetical protein
MQAKNMQYQKAGWNFNIIGQVISTIKGYR